MKLPATFAFYKMENPSNQKPKKIIMLKKISTIGLACLCIVSAQNANAQWSTAGANIYATNPAANLSIGTSLAPANLYVEKSGAVSLGIKSLSASATMFMDKGVQSGNAAFAYKNLGTTYWNSGMLGGLKFSIRNVVANTFPFAIDNATDNVGIGTLAPAATLHVIQNTALLGARIDGNVLIKKEKTVGSVPTDNHLSIDGITALTYYPSIVMWANATAGGCGLFGTTGVTGGGLNVGDETGGPFAPVNASAFNVSSDARMKKEIVTISSGNYDNYMAYIRTIQSATFRYNSETETSRPVPHIGVIAQTLPKECQAVISASPSMPGETRLALSLADMSGLLLVGVKSLDETQTKTSAIVATQQEEIAALKSTVQKLELQLQQNNTQRASLNSSYLDQNSPNPFNQSTTIRYQLAEEVANAEIVIRDIKGNLIKSLNLTNKGRGQVIINANELSRGTYTYTLEINGMSIDTKLMVVTK